MFRKLFLEEKIGQRKVEAVMANEFGKDVKLIGKTKLSKSTGYSPLYGRKHMIYEIGKAIVHIFQASGGDYYVTVYNTKLSEDDMKHANGFGGGTSKDKDQEKRIEDSVKVLFQNRDYSDEDLINAIKDVK